MATNNSSASGTTKGSTTQYYDFAQIENDKKAAIAESDKLYDGMIESSDSYYQAQIDATKEYGETQAKIQQEQTDFAIEQIEQQKEQTYKDYVKEQSGAYVDWQKQSNNYGSNAEQMAANGLAYTGYSESSKVAMYNQYQNRVATARETYNRAVLNYDNAIKDARIQNSAALAEIAFNTLQMSLDLSLAGFQYKNSLVMSKADKKAEIDDRYYNRYKDAVEQINTEAAMAEDVRQFNETIAEERRQYNETMAYNKSKSFNSGGGGSRSSSSSSSSAQQVKGSGNAVVDTASVIDLGYGPISGDALSDLVASGAVVATQNSNGVITVKNAGEKSSSKTPSKTDATIKKWGM